MKKITYPFGIKAFGETTLKCRGCSKLIPASKITEVEHWFYCPKCLKKLKKKSGVSEEGKSDVDI